jgi:hypothetical protein
LRRIHGEGIMEEESCREIVEKESWRRNHRGVSMEQTSGEI